MAIKKEVNTAAPKWFYYISILSAFLFTIYISIYSAIHFEDIKYMNLVVIFLFISLVSFFLISAVYFRAEKIGYHAFAPILFFIGIVALLAYAYKAVDATNIVKYSIIYSIAVVGISLFILLPRKRMMLKQSKNVEKKA